MKKYFLFKLDIMLCIILAFLGVTALYEKSIAAFTFCSYFNFLYVREVYSTNNKLSKDTFLLGATLICAGGLVAELYISNEQDPYLATIGFIYAYLTESYILKRMLNGSEPQK